MFPTERFFNRPPQLIHLINDDGSFGLSFRSGEAYGGENVVLRIVYVFSTILCVWLHHRLHSAVCAKMAHRKGRSNAISFGGARVHANI